MKEKESDEAALEFLKRISLAGWQHINFLGMYDFSKINLIDTEKIISIMMRQLNLKLSKMNAQKQEKVKK